MTPIRPPLSYLVEHAECWVKEEDAPIYYAVAQGPDGDTQDYPLQPEDISAEDPRILAVLVHYYSAPEHENMRDSLDEIWGSNLRACVALWENKYIEDINAGGRYIIHSLLKVHERTKGYVEVSVGASKIGVLPSGLPYAYDSWTELIDEPLTWLEQHYPSSISQLRIAQGLGLSPRETASFITDSPSVLSATVLPRDMLSE